MKLAELPLRRPVGTVMLLVSLMVLGGVAVQRMPLDFMPSFVEPEIDVEIPFPGSHPMEAMRDVAMPIEGEVATVPGASSTWATGRSGSAQVEVRFDWSADMDVKLMEVREAVERVRASLPAGVGRVRVEPDYAGGGGSILEGRVSAARDLSEAHDLLDRRIRRPLERIKGVARVDLHGVEPTQVRVDFDLDALRRHGVSSGEILDALDAANVDLDLGVVRGGSLRYEVRSLGRFRTLQEVRELPLGATGVRLSDVAQVSRRQPVLDYGRHLEGQFAVAVTVYKEPSANTVATVDRVLARVAEIEHDPELQGITLLVWENAGAQIRNSIGTLRDAGVFGGIMAVVVLYLFLRSLKNTAIVAASIPFSLLVTCGAMFFLGFDLNVLTMLGLMLGVGMLVDNAVVVMENIHRHQGSGMSAGDAARRGVREVFLAVVASTTTTLIVWAWLFVFEKDEMTSLMGQVAVSICLAVACSLVISVTFIPLAVARIRQQGRQVRKGVLIERVVPAYRRLLAWTLGHRVKTVIALLLLFASAAVPFSQIEKHGDPATVEQFVSVQYDVHDPATRDVLEGHVNEVEAWLEERKAELGYQNIYSWFAERGGTQTRLYLPPSQRTKNGAKRLRERLREGLPEIAGVTLTVGDRDWWRRKGRGNQRTVAVALHGEDPEYLLDLAADVEELLRVQDDVVEVYGPSLTGQKELRIRVDTERCRAAGLDPRRVARIVSFTFRGQSLRRFQAADGEIELVAGLPETVRPGVAALTDLPIVAEDGTAVSLSAVASIEHARTPPSVHRRDRTTTQWVSAEFDSDEVTTDQAREIVTAALGPLELPTGYSWDFGRRGRDRDEGLEKMFSGMGLSLVLVMLLMTALFESIMQPMSILITLLLAFSGALWSLWLLGYDFDAVAAIGLIILIGIVVNNGIVMVLHVNDLRREGAERTEALLQGCGDRLRPVLMTAITTIFGLVPLVVTGTNVAGAYIDTLGVAVMGGLTTSTVFTLVGLPVWYSVVEDFGRLLTRLVPRMPRARRAARGVLAS